MKEAPIKAIVRVWKKEPKSAIIIFPQLVERRYQVMMWEPIGQHGAGDPYAVVEQTRPATPQETERVVKEYENYYDASLVVRKRLPRIQWSTL